MAREMVPIWNVTVHAAHLPEINPTWLWVHCEDPHCGHARALPLVPWIIRWGIARKDVCKAMRASFYCSVCGRKGCHFGRPLLAGEGIEAFPPLGLHIRINGPRRWDETYPDAEERNRAEYLARYPSGDAITDFVDHVTGPAQMCGKFTAMASWAEVVAFTQPLTRDQVKESDNDRIVTFRVMSNLPVIIWDPAEGKRRVVAMRWGWPSPKDWKVPQPIHARAESIDDPKKIFARPFRSGQRGIVIVKNFNEAPDVPGPTVQHTITPGDQGVIGIAFVWKEFELADLPGTLRACVMVTVPANQLIATLPTDRMPAVLADEEWATWLGETGTPAEAKACLKTVEGVNWKLAREDRPRGKPTVREPGGLL